MKTEKSALSTRLLKSVSLGVLLSSALWADAPKMKMTTDIPASITTPDKAETSIGTLEFTDGFPSKTTIQKSYDYLDTMRAVDVFLNSIPIASLYAMREGFNSVGVTGNTIGIFENLMDSK